MTRARPLVAEVIGTAILTAVAFGTAMMGTRLTADPGLGLLCSSLTAGAALYVLITILGPVSGGHLNPAVTLAFALRRDTPPRTSLAYVLAQVLGALLGTMLAHLMFDAPILEFSAIPRDRPSLWLSEVIATAGLILVILGGLAAKGPVPAQVPALVGAYIMAGYWFTASSSFANPAITIARSLTGSAAGLRPDDLPAYLVAQVLGAGLGYAVARWLFANEKPPILADGG
jgi:glycerol uptake facilitator-like aquaporin